MPSEVKRGFVRIATNYVRLFASVVLGLFLVRLLLRSVGEDGFGLVSLFGSTVGLAAMFKEIIRASMIRELGSAYHSGDPGLFRGVYNTALAITCTVGAFVLVLFVLIWIFIDLFEINGMVSAARGLVAARALEVFCTIALAPTFNMYLVSERMTEHNLWLLMEQRLAQFIAALWVVFLASPASASEALILFSWSSSLLTVAGLLIACGVMVHRDRRLVPAPRLVNRAALRSILGIGGWNIAVVTAMNLHIRVNAVIMNLAFGLLANTIFGLAVQLTSYTRRLAVGVTDGLDSVSARMTSGPESESGRLSRLIHHSTRLNGFVTFPSTVAVVLLAGPMLQVWVGDRLDNPLQTIPPAAQMIAILSIGIAVRSVADGWTRILYGAGHVRQYAPWVLAGGLANPVLCFLLIWLLQGGTAEWNAPAWAFTLSVGAVHGVIIPWIGARLVSLRARDLLAPLIRPLIASLLAIPVLWGVMEFIEAWTLWTLGLALGVYGVTYALLSCFITLTASDWQLLKRLVRGGGRGDGAGRSRPRRRSAESGDDVRPGIGFD